MRIDTSPVEAYRQAGNQSLKKNPDTQPEFDLNKAVQTDKITLPGSNHSNTEAIRLSKSPSLLSSVLSSEEKTMLTRYFSRYGDSPESTRIYGTDARTGASGLTGLKVDLTG